jgi:hypothetical protein
MWALPGYLCGGLLSGRRRKFSKTHVSKSVEETAMLVGTRPSGRSVGLTGIIPAEKSPVGKCWIRRFFDADESSVTACALPNLTDQLAFSGVLCDGRPRFPDRQLHGSYGAQLTLNRHNAF